MSTNSSTYQIVNAHIVNEGSVIDGDLLLEKGRIVGINRPTPSTAQVYDAKGAWLLPGMIDDQVHFREPGFEYKGCFATESRAAVAGGITSYMEMPNSRPLTIDNSFLEDKHRRAAKDSMANYSFYLGATNDNIEAIKAVDPNLACGIKIFMGASTGDMLVDDEDALNAIFAAAPRLIATHCEFTPTILANEAAALAKYGEDIPIQEHPAIRSEEACYQSSSLAISLAKRHDARLHILHLTTAKELAQFTPGNIMDKRITAEACVHHLFFSDKDYAQRGVDIKCNPAIKTERDRLGLLAAVKNDLIDVIATDHAPHTREDKEQLYRKSAAGLPLVQHALASLFEHLNNGVLSIEQIVHKTAHAPALLFGIENRGFLREDYFGDVVLVEACGNQAAAEEPWESPGILSRCGWSPFRGIDFSHRIRATWVNGALCYDRGKFPDEKFRGMPLRCLRGR